MSSLSNLDCIHLGCVVMDMKISLLLASVVLFYEAPYATAADIPCDARWGDSGQICVCDSAHCDTVERPARLPPGQYHWYSTSNSTPGFSHTTGNFTGDTLVVDNEVVFKINSSIKYQEIFGFGGSFTDSVGVVLNTLPEQALNKLIESYFGPSGIEYSMGRLPIGGSDYSLRPYTLDDVPYDFELQYFNLTEEDYNYKIPVIQKAMSVSERGLKLLACTWAAPAWMKDNEDFEQGYIREKYLHVWAEYHIKFLEAYKQVGIDMWAVSGGNEVFLLFFLPVVDQLLNSTLMTAAIQREWYQGHLQPLIRASNFSHVKLITMEDQRNFALYWMERFAEYPESYDGIGLHWYFDPFIPTSKWDLLHNAYPDKLILSTESSINGVFGPKAVDLGSWIRAEAYIYNIMQNINHWTQCYIDWNLALNLEGGPTLAINTDAAIVVNQTSGEFYKQPIYYGLGHFSKFIPPGSFRIHVDSNQNKTSDETSAMSEDMLREFLSSTKYTPSKLSNNSSFPYRLIVPSVVDSLTTINPDGSYTVVVFNSMNETAHVRIEVPSNGNISVNIEEHSLNTFIYWPQ